MWLPSGRKYRSKWKVSKSQPLPILTLISTQRKLPIKVIVRQLLSNFFNLIVECEWIWLKRRLIWLTLFIVNAVNRYPWVRRVQSSSRLVWPAYGAFDHWYQFRIRSRHRGINSARTTHPADDWRIHYRGTNTSSSLGSRPATDFSDHGGCQREGKTEAYWQQRV